MVEDEKKEGNEIGYVYLSTAYSQTTTRNTLEKSKNNSLTNPSTFVPSPTTKTRFDLTYSPPKNFINAETLPIVLVPVPWTAEGAIMYECTSPARPACRILHFLDSLDRHVFDLAKNTYGAST